MPAAHQNWQSLGAGGLYGGNTAYGPTGSAGVPVSRDQMDLLRLGQGRTPEAEYPDGYLGTIRSRRDDRLLDSLKNRQNQRSYQRGVHKGERVDPSDYFFPEGLDPQRGLRNQARGKKTGPLMELAPAPHLVNDGKADVVGNQYAEVNPVRVAQLSSLRPAWR
jgi:hypothetical protein